MKQVQSYKDFEELLLNEPFPEVDYEHSRKFIKAGIEGKTHPGGRLGRVKNKLILAAIITLLAVPAYAIANIVFPEFGGHPGGPHTGFKIVDEESNKSRERSNLKREYVEKAYGQVIKEREKAIEPGTCEILIFPNKENADEKYLTYTIFKPGRITDYNTIAARVDGVLQPMKELPGGFTFSEGEIRYVEEGWGTTQEECETLFAEAQKAGKDYAIKQIIPTNEINYCKLIFKRLTNKEDYMILRINDKFGAIFMLEEEWQKETLSHNGNKIFFFEPIIEGKNLWRLYNFEKNGRTYELQTSLSIGREEVLAAIDYIMAHEDVPSYEEKEREAMERDMEAMEKEYNYFIEWLKGTLKVPKELPGGLVFREAKGSASDLNKSITYQKVTSYLAPLRYSSSAYLEIRKTDFTLFVAGYPENTNKTVISHRDMEILVVDGITQKGNFMGGVYNFEMNGMVYVLTVSLDIDQDLALQMIDVIMEQ